MEDLADMYNMRGFAKHHPALCTLITANIAVWIGMRILTAWQPAAASDMLLLCELPCSSPLMLHKPWTILTYMWMHTNGWHLFINMLCLWWFGMMLPQGRGWRLEYIYIAGGICGGIFYSLVGAAPENMLMGSSASVLAIAVAVTTVNPNRKIHLPILGAVNLWWITAAIISVDVASVAFGDFAGHIAHLGGAALGLIAGWRIKRWRFTPVGHQNLRTTVPDMSTERIIAKIRRSGHGSLTSEERQILFKVSRGK